MEARFVRGLVNLMTGFIIGMMVMAGFYCNALNITSGNMYIGWDTITIVSLCLIAVYVMIHFDPSFNDDGWKEHAEDHYAQQRKRVRITAKPSNFVADNEAKEEEKRIVTLDSLLKDRKNN